MSDQPAFETTPPPGPKLRPVDLQNILAAEIAPPREIIQGLVYALVVTLLGGHGGAGKSILALILAAHVAAGCAWAGRRVRLCQVVYFSLEDPGDLVRYRLRRIIEAYDLDGDRVARNLRIFDGCDVDAELMVEASQGGIRHLVETPMLGEVEAAAAGAGLTIIDNASDAFGGDEILRRQVRPFIRRLAKTARANNAGLILLAHIDKMAARQGSSGNSYSGSTAWHNSTRSRLALTPSEDGSVELVQEKNNLGAKAEAITLTWDGPVLMPQVRDHAADQANRERQLADDADAILEVVRIAIRSGATVPASLSGPATAAHALEPFPELGAEFQGKHGRAKIRAAITQLLRDGRLAKVEYQNDHRHTRTRLELTQMASNGAPESALRQSPIPPSTTGARTGSALMAEKPTDAALTHNRRTDADCRCGGEGDCGYCNRKVAP
jgi:RecA-family ATPase